MTSTIAPVLKQLKQYEEQTINVVDVGSARAAFLVELRKEVALDRIFSIGIDPVHSDHGYEYTKFYHACVDNIEEEYEVDFFLNPKDDQGGTLCGGKEWDTKKIKVMNLNTIIKDQIPEELIHFIKIDAEGKDIDIVKSLTREVTNRVKYIAIECPSSIARFDGEYNMDQCIGYFDSIGFDVCHHYRDGKTDLNDVVFVNRMEL